MKLFLATLPPPEAGVRIANLGDIIIKARGFRGHRIARPKLHGTLAAIDLGRTSFRDAVMRAKAAAAQVRATAFPVRFEWTQSFAIPRAATPSSWVAVTGWHRCGCFAACWPIAFAALG